MGRGLCLTAVIEPGRLPPIALWVWHRLRCPPVRPGKNFRATDRNDLHLQFEGLAGPAPVGVNDHPVLLDFHNTDQAAALTAVLDAHPHPDGEVFVSREACAGQTVDAAGGSDGP